MNSDSDLQIAGDILEVPHLLQPAREHPATVAEFVGLARSIAADRAQWAHLVRYDATTRWYHRLRTGPGYEVWLLSAGCPARAAGCTTTARSSGVLTVLDGELTERTERGHARARRRRAARLRARLRPRGRQRRPRTGRQPARLLPGPDRDADARRCPAAGDRPRPCATVAVAG